MASQTNSPVARGETAVPAEQADMRVMEALDAQTRDRIERVRAFADEVRNAIRTLRREAHGLKQSELAERLGVSTSTVSRLESGNGLSGLDLELVLFAFAELNAAPMLTLLDPSSPGAGQVVDFTSWPETRALNRGGQAAAQSDATVETQAIAASHQRGHRAATVESLDAVAYGLQSELRAMRLELTRLSDQFSAPAKSTTASAASAGARVSPNDKASASGASS
ncbi:helix-turn-helix transcriptional regulator [Rhodovibrio sodomensis]|nr:helix-turn-helix domain-containing protein [Rhodovibrio sodomensis]